MCTYRIRLLCINVTYGTVSPTELAEEEGEEEEEEGEDGEDGDMGEDEGSVINRTL